MASVSIKGLSEVQCQALEGVQVGDFIWMQRARQVESYEDGEVGEDVSESGDEGLREHEQDDDDEAGGQSDGEPANDLAAVVEPSVKADDERQSDVEEVDDDSASIKQSVEGEADPEHVAGAPEAQTEGDASSEPDVEAGAPEAQNEGDASSEPDVEANKTDNILGLVRGIVKDASGTIVDIEFLNLVWAADVNADNSGHTFQIYGNDLSHTVSEACDHDDCASLLSAADVAARGQLQDYAMHVKPEGDVMRASHGNCPALCNNGWLSDAGAIARLIKDYNVVLTLPCCPVCPVCVGLDQAKEYLDLRATLETSHFVDLTTVLDFYFALNPRRQAIGLQYTQYDEREWNLLFDDMLTDDESDDGYYGQYEQASDEAMDPNANVKTRPASAATLAALPRKAFAETAAAQALEGTADEELQCGVCLSAPTLDTIAIELPCKHAFDEDCIVNWLKQFGNCPTCRAEVEAVEDTKSEDNEDVTAEEDAGVSSGYEADESEVEAKDEDDTETVMDDEDDVMFEV